MQIMQARVDGGGPSNSAEGTVSLAPPPRSRFMPVLGLLLIGILFLARLGAYPLQDPDEGRYAEIPREMIESGDWLTPHLNYVKYYEKPPLLYWLVAFSFEIFGLGEWAARLVPALCGLLTVFSSFLLGRAMFGPRAAWIGAGILACSPLFFGLTQILVIDMLLTACMTLTLAAFFIACREPHRPRWVLGVALGAALGVLAKGLVALVLPGAIALLFLLLRRDFTMLRALLGIRPIGVFLAVAVPWFVWVAIVNPEFPYYIFVREHFERFTSGSSHREGLFYYVPIVFFGLFPWTAVAAALAWARQGRTAWAALAGDERRFLLLWAGLILGFFFVSRAKLAPYILPAFPPLALLGGAWIDRSLVQASARMDGILRGTAGGYMIVGAVAAVSGLVAWPLADRLSAVFRADPSDVRLITHAVLGTAAVLLVAGRLARRPSSAVLPECRLVCLILGLTLALLTGFEARGVAKSSAGLGRAIVARATEGDLVASYHHLMQGLSFYTRRRVVQIDNSGELTDGALHAVDRSEWFWKGTERLVREWTSGRKVFLATTNDRLDEIADQLEPAPRVLTRRRKRVLVTNFSSPAHVP